MIVGSQCENRSLYYEAEVKLIAVWPERLQKKLPLGMFLLKNDYEEIVLGLPKLHS